METNNSVAAARALPVGVLRLSLTSAGQVVEVLASDPNSFGDVVSLATRNHERSEAARHAATIQAMRDDRCLGLRYGADCYNGSPGWWRYHTRRDVAKATGTP